MSGWTFETLRIYIESRLADMHDALQERYETQIKATDKAFAAQQTAMEAALAAQEKAVEKANAAGEKRFDSVNEFRAQLTDQAATFMPRQESEMTHRAMDSQFHDTTNRMGERLSKLELASMSRREVEAVIQSYDTRIKGLVDAKDRQHAILLDQITANALAIEKANAAGQTIYVLRSEAAGNARVVEDKIATATAAAAAANKLTGDAVTELRASLADQATKFMPRAESETRTTATTERLREIEIRMQSYPSRDETAVALNAADAKFAAGIGSVTEKTDSMSDRMAAMELRLSSRLDLSAGKTVGTSATVTYLYGAIAALAALVAIFFALKP